MNAMIESSLNLPARQGKPRTKGLTMAIDNGLPTRLFADSIETSQEYIDIVKFGWGTALVTPELSAKTAVLDDQGIKFMFGGTLFEKYVSQDRLGQYMELCHRCGCKVVEVSNGTIDLDIETKAKYIAQMSAEFEVIAEVGYKDHPRSDLFSPRQWVDSIRSDIDAGAKLVILEARESGSSGICRPNGELRYGLIEDILDSGIDTNALIFEAPKKELQTYFILRLGADVNLGNIGFLDLIALETLRLGLRSDTLSGKSAYRDEGA
jgi:phosphosulfolactate synthase